jgi:hypothetical protein
MDIILGEVTDMKITDRDIEILGWILEERFMTERQIKRVFWKDITEKSREAYRRLRELEKERYLETDKERIYQWAVYSIPRKGARLLMKFGRNQGLGESHNAVYCRHDSVVTDIRILFHELGYTQWLSERVLSKRNDFRRIPDGMVFYQDRYIAIEYESSQKSKRRYKKIFLDYELDRLLDKVLYITSTLELSQKLLKEAAYYHKLYFVGIQDLQRDGVYTRLKNLDEECSLQDFFETPYKPKPVF